MTRSAGGRQRYKRGIGSVTKIKCGRRHNRRRVVFHFAVGRRPATWAETTGGAQPEPRERAADHGPGGNRHRHRNRRATGMGKRKHLAGHVAKRAVAVKVKEVIQRARRRGRHADRGGRARHQRQGEGHAIFVICARDIIAGGRGVGLSVGFGVNQRTQEQRATRYVTGSRGCHQGRIARIRCVAEVKGGDNRNRVVFHLAISRRAGWQQTTERAQAEAGKGAPNRGPGRHRDRNRVGSHYQSETRGDLLARIEPVPIGIEVHPGVQFTGSRGGGHRRGAGGARSQGRKSHAIFVV